MGRTKLLSFVILLFVIAGELYIVSLLWGFGRVGRVFTNNYLNPAFFKFGKFNVLGVSKQQLMDQMKEYDPELTNVKITKKLNGDIYIDVAGIEEKYMLADKDETQFFSADERGVVIKEATGQDKLLIVTGKASLKKGSKMDSESERAALILVDKVAKYPALEELKKVIIQDDKLLMVFERNFVVILPIVEDLDSYLQSLQILLDRFTIEGKLPQEIDMRYIRAVVKM